PESVKYDEEQDVYFVSNINGNPSQKDGNGFISRIEPDSMLVDTTFIAGGTGGVVLNAPKGLAITGDTLWVTDIDVVRGFNRETGAPVGVISFESHNPRFLNDIATGPDGALFVTDMGVVFAEDGSMTSPGPERIFRIAPDRRVTIALEADSLGGPNGLTWDDDEDHFIVATFGSTSVLEWSPGDSAAPVVVASGPGMFDGVEIIGDDRVLVSSWADSSIQVLVDGQMTTFIRDVPTPADIGYDDERDQVLIPIFTGNRVEIWSVPEN
ncbi:MAG: SMP-30/gluconolactonase/LRE family protein, partial [Gemmatimonadaceae bacterium]